jgi:Fur family ferric uptake transcriptional regulator
MERRTTQRDAIRAAVEHADRPMSTQEILEAAGKLAPGLGLATVYRTVKAGIEGGWLKPVDLPGGPTRYEPGGKHHHHHFECRACNRVFEVEGCPDNLRGLVPAGFQLEDHDVTLYGLCDTCNHPAPASRKASRK